MMSFRMDLLGAIALKRVKLCNKSKKQQHTNKTNTQTKQKYLPYVETSAIVSSGVTRRCLAAHPGGYLWEICAKLGEMFAKSGTIRGKFKIRGNFFKIRGN